ncbi:hypothetical protein HQ520_00690, partial [bacterium]|nr:hypothetical protein [bacterium]
RMTSFVNRYIDRDMLRHPQKTRLFMVEVDGNTYGADDFDVQKIEPASDGKSFAADLLLAEKGLGARLTVGFDQPGRIRMALDLENRGEKPLDFKTAFPQVGGLVLSDEAESDYYLFPFFGGIISDRNTMQRAGYGENLAWWQMIDLYSPERGGGVYLRCLDDTAQMKYPTLRKGEESRTEFNRTLAGKGYPDKNFLWEFSLEPAPGTAMTFEYLRRTREPKGSFSPPEAILGVHAGDWHGPMKEYGQWAHEKWGSRPRDNALMDYWNIGTAGWGEDVLVNKDGYRMDVLKPSFDLVELQAWWDWQYEYSLWHLPIEREKARELLGEKCWELRKYWWVDDPMTGELAFTLNTPDYQYSERHGGLEALQDYIRDIRKTGTLPMFYMNGRKGCASSRIGHEYGPQYGVMNPRWGDPYEVPVPVRPENYAGSYAAYEFCTDTEWWQNYLTDAVRRIVKDTGIAGVRLDQLVQNGITCESDKHDHLFGEPGHNATVQADAHLVQRVREAMDEVNPKAVLTAEFPGLDRAVSYMDGTLIHDCSRVFPYRPFPCNLLRFYFPECRGYELEAVHFPQSTAWKFWNSVGTFYNNHPQPYFWILKGNADLFVLGEGEALPPTLVERVYANRFVLPAKKGIMLFNARRHTVNEPLIQVNPARDDHFIEIVRWEELQPVQSGNGQAIGVRLRKDEVACILQLPRRVTLEENNGSLRVKVSGQTDGLRLILAGANGETLAEKPAQESVDFALVSGEGEKTVRVAAPWRIKLMGKKYLIDAAVMKDE